jgi:acyl-CoA thioester hydrolase
VSHDFACHVRFSDVDIYGHVNNVKYYEYYQEARVGLMHALKRADGEALLSLVVARLDVDYKRPMLFRIEPYTITSRVSHVGNSSFVIESLIHDAGTTYSTARAVMVAFDPHTQSKVALTDGQRIRLALPEAQ